MISKTTIEKIEEIVLREQGVTPPHFHINLSNREGQKIAGMLNANREIVMLGTLFMDCALGEALQQGKLKEHVKMSVDKAEKILNEFSEITEVERKNIMNCIKEHHGTDKFSSLESEIVCNADCYRFISVEGVIGGIKNFRDIEVNDLVVLWLEKADEKWNALSLDICRKELEPQYRVIKQFLENYKN
ncbi:MAG: hypothetical protein AB1333_01910 [Patescibacteria group bacterium]